MPEHKYPRDATLAAEIRRMFEEAAIEAERFSADDLMDGPFKVLMPYLLGLMGDWLDAQRLQGHSPAECALDLRKRLDHWRDMGRRAAPPS